MITKLFRHTWLGRFIIPFILFIVLVFSYGSYSRTIPVFFWDEILWVGRSYFFEIFIHRDFNNRIWQSREAYDQPKLAEYSYGAWLYPLYLKEKIVNPEPYDYTRFLIQNGFYEIDENYMDTYARYKNNHNVVRFDHRMYGFPEEWVAKYGQDSLKPINLIYYARILSIFLLAGSVIFAYFLALQYGGLIYATLLSTLYGFNYLIIDSGLKAHSEALFLFTFNAAFLFMNLYFVKKRNMLYLLLFSLFAGLCMSTKINGLMLSIIFFTLNIVLYFVLKEKNLKYILLSLVPLALSFMIFIILNPFTYADPLKNTQYMFDSRMNTAVAQMKYFYEAAIPNPFFRIEKIFGNFYFSEQTPYFNGIRLLEQLTTFRNYGVYLFIPFLFGLFYLLKNVIQRNLSALIIFFFFISVLGFMAYYLFLDWGRYYVHLVLFFAMLQTLGLYIIGRQIYNYSKLLTKQAINRARKK